MADVEVGYFSPRAAPGGGPLAPLLPPPSAPCVPFRESVLTDTWHGQQTTQGFSSLGTAMTEVIRFSGFPDRIEIWILDNNAVIQFTDEQQRPTQEITVLAGNFYEPQIRQHTVRARNATAGLVARIQVVGKWLAQSKGQ